MTKLCCYLSFICSCKLHLMQYVGVDLKKTLLLFLFRFRSLIFFLIRHSFVDEMNPIFFCFSFIRKRKNAVLRPMGKNDILIKGSKDPILATFTFILRKGKIIVMSLKNIIKGTILKQKRKKNHLFLLYKRNKLGILKAS